MRTIIGQIGNLIGDTRPDHRIKCDGIRKTILRKDVISPDLQNAKSCDVLPSLLHNREIAAVKNKRIYAIGDVHGCSDLLARLVDFIDNHAQRVGSIPVVYFLGDIVDRGYHPLGAMVIVRDSIRRWPGSRLFRGNHEQMFLDILDNVGDEHLMKNFLRNGGYNTLRSFIGYDDPYTVEEISDITVRHTDHITLMRNASMIETVGRYAFVHAGVAPHIAINKQGDYDLMWIKDKFLDYTGPLSHVIVHGHSIQESFRPVVTENRISLDTGAYRSGALSMASIDPETDDIDFFSTTPCGAVKSVEPILMDRGFGTALLKSSSNHPLVVL